MQNDEYLVHLADYLREEGYKAKISENGQMITSGVGGMTVGVFPYENNTIQISFGVELDEDVRFGLDQANAYNRAYRYAKVYIDDDGDVVLSADYLLDLNRPTVSEDIRRIMTNFEGCVAMFRNTLAAEESSGEIE